jgi:hypothetical protein
MINFYSVFVNSALALLVLAFFAGFFQGLGRLVTPNQSSWTMILMLGATAAVNLLASCFAPKENWRRMCVVYAVCLGVVMLLMMHKLSVLTIWQKLEIGMILGGIGILVSSFVGRFNEKTGRENDSVTIGLFFGSLMIVGTLLIATLHHRFVNGTISGLDEGGLIIVTALLVLIGYGSQLKSPTMVGGSGLAIYLLVLIYQIAYFPDIPVAVYMAIGGGSLFALGVVLSLFRDRIISIKDKVAQKEGVFEILKWR